MIHTYAFYVKFTDPEHIAMYLRLVGSYLHQVHLNFSFFIATPCDPSSVSENEWILDFVQANLSQVAISEWE